jgi:Zn-dependent protease
MELTGWRGSGTGGEGREGAAQPELTWWPVPAGGGPASWPAPQVPPTPGAPPGGGLVPAANSDAWPAPPGAPTWGAAPPPPEAGTGRRRGRARSAWQRLLGTLAAIGAFIAKFGALALKIKYLGLVLSMFVSVAAYALLWGWTFAAGFVALMFVHEMGHVVELKRQGVRASLPMFVPFLGAFVSMKEAPRSAYQEALSGLAGPYFGTAASVVVAFWGHATGSGFLTQLAAFGFMLNLFNLLPMLPLDGGRAAAALHPALWLAGLVGLVAMAFVAPSPVLLLVLVLGAVELWRRWSRRKSPQARAYNALRAGQRWLVAGLYVGVVAVTLVGFQLTYVARSL